MSQKYTSFSGASNEMRRMARVSLNGTSYDLLSNKGDPFMVPNTEPVSPTRARVSLNRSKTGRSSSKFSPVKSIVGGNDALVVCTGGVCKLSEGRAQMLTIEEDKSVDQLPPAIIPIFSTSQVSGSQLESVHQQNVRHRNMRYQENHQALESVRDSAKLLSEEISVALVNLQTAWSNLHSIPQDDIPSEHMARNQELRTILTDKLNNKTRELVDGIQSQIAACTEGVILFNRMLAEEYDWESVLSKSV